MTENITPVNIKKPPTCRKEKQVRGRGDAGLTCILSGGKTLRKECGKVQLIII